MGGIDEEGEEGADAPRLAGLGLVMEGFGNGQVRPEAGPSLPTEAAGAPRRLPLRAPVRPCARPQVGTGPRRRAT
jgi:hypothetical protein